MFASNISVSEKYWLNASNIVTSQVPLCDQYHPVSEICEKQATSDIDTVTRWQLPILFRKPNSITRNFQK